MSCVLGIDTSNYTTSCAIYDSESKKAVSKKKLLPVKKGERGIRQSDAVFHHTKQMPELMKELFSERVKIDAVAYSYAPRCVEGSYMPCFLVGENVAVSVGSALGTEIYGTSHQVGHVLSALYSAGKTDLIKSGEKFLAFHISGGTTDMLLCTPERDSVLDIQTLGSSLDLKAGQAVDRVGVMLGLQFPCGNELERLAVKSQREFKIRPVIKGSDCCLSGLENKCEKMISDGEKPEDTAKFCLDYIYETIRAMLLTALENYGEIPVVFAGGVMSDMMIRQKLENEFGGYFAEPCFSSDNAVGIAVFGGNKEGTYLMGSVLTVSQLNKYVAYKIRSDLKLKGIAIKGEISNFSVHYKSGHAYFTVKDENSAVKAVMFAGSFSRLKFMPEDGMKVLVTCNAEIYERDGAFQIIVSDMTPVGAGIIHTRIEQVKEKLKSMGVFDEKNKKAIPVVPEKIAVVTSLTGAALQDVLHIVQRRYPVCSVLIFPAQVQGENAVRSICEALEKADKSGADTIILTRGGGSLEDLMPFNTEEVALAVAGCTTPVITAVGHETDTSLCDYAADMRAPTPSAAAELATPDKNDILNAVELMKKRLDKAVLTRLETQSVQLELVTDRIRSRSPEKILEKNFREIELLDEKIYGSVRHKIEKAEALFDKISAKLNALSPFNVLSRGYSLVEKNGVLIDSTDMLEKGDTVRIRFSDSSATAQIISMNDDKERSEKNDF